MEIKLETQNQFDIKFAYISDRVEAATKAKDTLITQNLRVDGDYFLLRTVQRSKVGTGFILYFREHIVSKDTMTYKYHFTIGNSEELLKIIDWLGVEK